MSAILTPAEHSAAVAANASRGHSALVLVTAQIFRETASAPSEMTMIEIDRAFDRLREAAYVARKSLVGFQP